MRLHCSRPPDCFFNEFHELCEKDFNTLRAAGRLLACENLVKIKDYGGLFVFYANMDHIKIKKLYIKEGMVDYNEYISFSDYNSRGIQTIPFHDAFILFDNKMQAASFKLKNF